MFFERVKSPSLAHISYFVGSETEAVVIDPRRDCQVYVEIAKKEGMSIKYIFETHRNEDYVIGSTELQNLTGAKIYHGAKLGFKYGEPLEDGQSFNFGNLKLKAIHTPGHTVEHMSYVLYDVDVEDKPVMVFTGDVLFVGDVGRTDFYEPELHRRNAESLYDSIFKKILPLGDHVIICPGHGAGSVCGGEISAREYSTLGLEKASNPLLQKTREEFVKHKLSEHHEKPPYFKKMEEYNLEGPPVLYNLPNPPSLSPEEFQKKMKADAVVLDTRSPVSFGSAHIEGSYNIMFDALSLYTGWLLDYDTPILLILEDIKYLDEAVRRLVRIGYDKIIGYLQIGIEAWYNAALPVESFNLLTVHRLKKHIDKKDKFTLLDVRGKDEWEKGHIEQAINIFYGHLNKKYKELTTDNPIIVICNSGKRASFAVSILRKKGFEEVSNVLGGTTAWEKANYPTTT